MTAETFSLTDHELAKLHARFVVPIVVDQMLRDEEPLDDVAEYAMNEILFELCPDTALLCLAMCASHIAKATGSLPAGKALAVQCEQIITEYGPLWLAHEQNPETIDNDMVRETLSFIPEDLEALRDLLEATMADLEEDHCIAAILCDILSLQAEHHLTMAEIELNNLNLRPQSRPVVELAKTHGDNVIPFPAAPRNPRHQVRS